jgi:hypothetical protein
MVGHHRKHRSDEVNAKTAMVKRGEGDFTMRCGLSRLA